MQGTVKTKNRRFRVKEAVHSTKHQSHPKSTHPRERESSDRLLSVKEGDKTGHETIKQSRNSISGLSNSLVALDTLT